MKGDFTRSTYKQEKHNSSVRMQQGRVLMDADWNEQLDIQAHLDRTALHDVIGRCGAPAKARGFVLDQLTYLYLKDGQVQTGPLDDDVSISGGRLYLDGILCENDTSLQAAAIEKDGSVRLPALIVDGRAIEKGQVVEVRDGSKIIARAPVSGIPEGRRLAFDKTISSALASYAASAKKADGYSLRRITTYRTQPDLPRAPPFKGDAKRRYIYYLDVWERHLTAVEAPYMREIALFGPDTATRTRTIWQVKIEAATAASVPKSTEAPDEADPFVITMKPESTKNRASAATKKEKFSATEAKAAGEKVASQVVSRRDRCQWMPSAAKCDGELMARADPQLKPVSVCQSASGSGYHGLENQLYRVEVNNPKGRQIEQPAASESQATGTVILVEGGGKPAISHKEEPAPPEKAPEAPQGGEKPALTFKWSRNNGYMVSLLKDIEKDGSVVVADPGKDAVTGFAGAKWIELSDEPRVLHGLPGILLEVVRVQGDVITVKGWPGNTPMTTKDFYETPTVRRWDGVVDCETVSPDKWIDLEDGIQVSFTGGSYCTGDYWTIPARSVNGSIEWPADAAGAIAMKRHGIEHHYVPLAVTEFNRPTESWKLTPLCCNAFQPLTEQGSAGGSPGDAGGISYVPGCPQLKNLGGIDNVQAAIDALCRLIDKRGCTVVVDAGGRGDFRSVDEAIASLIGKDQQTDACICVMPGDQHAHKIRLDTDQEKPLNIKIVGCGNGTRLAIDGPWHFEGLTSLTLKDIGITTTGDSGIVCDHCSNVSMSFCQVRCDERREGGILEFNDCGNVRIASCEIVDAFPERGNPKLISISGSAKSKGKPSIAFDHDLISSDYAHKADNDITYPGIALLINDGFANVSIVDSVIRGDIRLYGPALSSNPTDYWIEKDNADKLTHIWEQAIDFSGARKTLYLRSNQLTGVAVHSKVSEGISQAISEVMSDKSIKPVTFDVFRTLSMSDNVCGSGHYQFVACDLKFTSNTMTERSDAFFMATNFICTGNSSFQDLPVRYLCGNYAKGENINLIFP